MEIEGGGGDRVTESGGQTVSFWFLSRIKDADLCHIYTISSILEVIVVRVGCYVGVTFSRKFCSWRENFV